MLMLPYGALYIAGGLLAVRWLLPGQPKLYRLWLGTALGLFLLMWLPALTAFLLTFSVAGHLAALAPLGLLTWGAWALGDKKRAPAAWGEEDTRALHLLLFTALPLTLLGGYLQYTHNLRVQEGALYVGQSTYGDLSLHTGIITSLRGARFPAEYSILPGARLSYPFLADSLSTTCMLFGFSLQAALWVPGTLIMALTFSGFLLLALSMAGARRVAVLAFFLVFINGGLGFVYPLDMLGQSLGNPGSNALQGGTWLQRLTTILQGWYQTPANHAEFARYNLRWSNLIADMLIPQRTFLGGWTLLMPCLYLLWAGLKQDAGIRAMALLGVLAGGLPLIHTHSFLALGLCSLGWMACHLLKKGSLKPWLVYGGIAVVLALPQLLAFTFQQATGSGHFLRFQFNWVNNPGGRGLRDGYLWFWLKNVGLPFVLLVFSLFEKNKKHRFIYAGAFTIFLVAELVLFQPNEYDNNKLFYVWYALCAVPVSAYAFSLWDRLKGLKARPLMGAMVCGALFLSGGLSIAREAASNLQAYSPQAVQAARYAEESTPARSLFLASPSDHLNPIPAISGRRIVCGPDLWLYYHGFDTQERKQDIAQFYQDPRGNPDVLHKYGVDYILLGPAERREYGAQPQALDALFEKVYQDDQGDYIIYQVPPG